MMPGQTSDNPLRISVEDLHARLEAGEPATVFDVRNPNDWDRSNWKIPGALRPLQGEIALDPRWPRTRLIVAYLNLTAGSRQRPCGAPAPRPWLHGGIRPAQWISSLGSRKVSGRTERVNQVRIFLDD